MKLRLVLALLSCSCLAHAEEADKQSIYQISGTTTLTLSTTTSVRGAVIPNTVRAIRIVSKVDAHCKFGDVSATATVSDSLFPAYTPEVIKVQPSDGNYFACLADSAGGLLYYDNMKP